MRGEVIEFIREEPKSRSEIVDHLDEELDATTSEILENIAFVLDKMYREGEVYMAREPEYGLT